MGIIVGKENPVHIGGVDTINSGEKAYVAESVVEEKVEEVALVEETENPAEEIPTLEELAEGEPAVEETPKEEAPKKPARTPRSSRKSKK